MWSRFTRMCSETEYCGVEIEHTCTILNTYMLKLNTCVIKLNTCILYLNICVLYLNTCVLVIFEHMCSIFEHMRSIFEHMCSIFEHMCSKTEHTCAKLERVYAVGERMCSVWSMHRGLMFVTASFSCSKADDGYFRQLFNVCDVWTYPCGSKWWTQPQSSWKR